MVVKVVLLAATAAWIWSALGEQCSIESTQISHEILRQ
jgi:hypothetical protein